MSHRYLFPYERIPCGSRIIIYGAGDLGQDYLLQMKITHFCDVVAVADRNYLKYPPMTVRLIDPFDIHEYEFDYVVVAIRMQAAYSEIVLTDVYWPDFTPEVYEQCLVEYQSRDRRFGGHK